MKDTYTIHADEHVTSIQITGIVSERTIKTILKRVWNEQNYQTPGLLWDFRLSTLGLGLKELHKLRRVVSVAEGHKGYGKVAFVGEKDLHFKLLSRLYADDASQLPFEVKGFRELEGARHWLQRTTQRIPQVA